jgi:inosine-uridine nucleoside N-ribohydrolase
MIRVRRLAKIVLGAIAVLAALFAITLTLPVAAWRTGRAEIEPLDLAPAGEYAVAGRRIWIDTDAACGAGRTTDPDDCLALLALLKAPDLDVAGVSTVFGNAPLKTTDRTARELISQIGNEGIPIPRVHRGRSSASTEEHEDAPAESALRQALEQAPLVIVALGPLTNIAAALRDRPALMAKVQQIIAVMGQRSGHVFHPVEGGTAPMLLGHGPVFQDLNYTKDPEAAAEVISLGLPLTLIPYDAAREVAINAADLETIGSAGASASWAAERSRGCRRPDLWRWIIGETGLFVDQPDEGVDTKARQTAVYCPSTEAGLHDTLVSGLTK